MKIEIIESVPIISCHACNTALAVTRILLNKKVAVLLCESCLYELERTFWPYVDKWISVKDRQPEGSPIVFMYSESNNEYSVSHFVLNRAGIPVTHWRPLEPPTVKAAILQQRKKSEKVKFTFDENSLTTLENMTEEGHYKSPNLENAPDKFLRYSEIIQLLENEANWCKDHPQIAPSPEFLEGFLAGLLQAKHFATKLTHLKEKK
jgi:hypothetical protein